jgi:hypothetical protein
MLDGADFLFPRDLEVTPSSLTTCLFVGSCTAETCRVLGLDVEVGVLRQIVREMRAAGIRKPISASIVETSSNLPCRDVYTRAGFAALGDGAFVCETVELGEAPKHLSLTWEN